MKLKNIIVSCSLGSLAVTALAQSNIIEEVAWWIGDQPIYKSDIEEAYLNRQYQHEDIQGDPYCVIPEELAVEKLYLHQAELDSVEVQDAMIMQEVDQRINYFITNLGTQQKVEEYFHRPLPEIREMLREMSANQARVQEVQQKLTGDIKPTPSDIRRYFNSLPKDSVPYIPMTVEVQILTLNPVIPREEIEEVKRRLRDYTERINSGESDFSTLAILYSEDGSSVRGGELGFMGKGHLEPEYAAVAFNLNDPKKVSKIVETPYGFHIIQLIEKRGDRINTRHILLRPKVSDRDLTDAVYRLDSLRNDILGGKYTFEEAVKYVSQDKDTRNSRGVMLNDMTGSTRFEMSQLPQEISREVSTMNVGDLSKPFIMKDPKRGRDIVAMVKLTNRLEGHRATLGDDYQTITNMYENAERENILNRWVEKKIRDTYVRIEDGWRDCEFKHQGWIKTANQ